MFMVPKRKHHPLLESVDHFFEDANHWFQPLTKQAFSAPIAIRSDEKNVYIETELPGVSQKDVQVEYQDGILTIEATKTAQKDDQEETYSYTERRFGKVTRSVRVGSEINFDKAKATLTDGILHITIPKSDETKRKLLSISA